jgi:hypothetical protein
MMPDRVKELAAMRQRKGGPRLGHDGVIPPKYQAAVRNAIEIAWRLITNPAFVETFRDTVAKLRGKSASEDIYATALNKMIINSADTAKNPRIMTELKADKAAVQKDRSYQQPPAYSLVDGTDIWICEWQLAKGDRAVAASIIHEATHLAGAPNNPIAEMAIDRIHQAAGIPR